MRSIAISCVFVRLAARLSGEKDHTLNCEEVR
jgi:hypothetical protein